MKYIAKVKIFYEPDNNTPKSETYIQTIEAKNAEDAYSEAVKIECELLDEDTSIVDSDVSVFELKNTLIKIDEEF